MKTRTKKGIIPVIVIGVICYIYIHTFMWPGKLDYFLRGKYYNEIMKTLLSPWYENIFAVDSQYIIFNDTTKCFSSEKYGIPACDKKYDELLNVVYKSNVKWAAASGNTGTIHHSGFIWRYHEIDYSYNKQGYSDKEKATRHMVDDHWIIH